MPESDQEAGVLGRVDLGAARTAAEILEAIADRDGMVSAEMVTRLKGLPVMLRASGLPATLAFFASKSGAGGALGMAYQVVGAGLRSEVHRNLPSTVGVVGTIGLIEKLADAQPEEVAVTSAKVDALAIWLRRLAEAVDKEQSAKPADDPAAADGPNGEAEATTGTPDA